MFSLRRRHLSDKLPPEAQRVFIGAIAEYISSDIWWIKWRLRQDSK